MRVHGGEEGADFTQRPSALHALGLMSDVGRNSPAGETTGPAWFRSPQEPRAPHCREPSWRQTWDVRLHRLRYNPAQIHSTRLNHHGPIRLYDEPGGQDRPPQTPDPQGHLPVVL